MSIVESRKLFNEANRLFFDEGQYNKVLSLYREALKHDLTDPVILYQLANVLWAFEQFNEVQELISQAEQYQHRLSLEGKKIFIREKSRLITFSGFRYQLPILASEIDLNKLESMYFLHGDWLDIAYAAEERRMFKLAAHALDKSSPFIDFDNAKDSYKILGNNKKCFDELEIMRDNASRCGY